MPGGATIEKWAAGIAKNAAAAVAWHWAQFALVLGALAWMSVSVGSTEKSLPWWQEVHDAVAAYGMWLVGLD